MFELYRQLKCSSNSNADRFFVDRLASYKIEATTQSTPAEQIRHIAEGALDDVYRQPEVFRFYLNLFTQPKLDPIVAKYSPKLMDEQARQFQVQTKMFEELGVDNPQQRSLYFSSTLQGIMLMFSTYPKSFPLDVVKAQVIVEFCGE